MSRNVKETLKLIGGGVMGVLATWMYHFGAFEVSPYLRGTPWFLLLLLIQLVLLALVSVSIFCVLDGLAWRGWILKRKSVRSECGKGYITKREYEASVKKKALETLHSIGDEAAK
jgi:hypothetical protein